MRRSDHGGRLQRRSDGKRAQSSLVRRQQANVLQETARQRKGSRRHAVAGHVKMVADAGLGLSLKPGRVDALMLLKVLVIMAMPGQVMMRVLAKMRRSSAHGPMREHQHCKKQDGQQPTHASANITRDPHLQRLRPPSACL